MITGEKVIVVSYKGLKGLLCLIHCSNLAVIEMAVPMESLETGEDMTISLEDDVAFENLIASTAITEPDVICVENGNQFTKELLNIRTERDEIKAELVDLQTRFETILGENTMLRSAFNNLQEQMHTLKLQQIMETEANRQELQSQVDKLTRECHGKCTNIGGADRQPTERELMMGQKRKVLAMVGQEQENLPFNSESAIANQRFRKYSMHIHGLDLHVPEAVLNNEESVWMSQKMEEKSTLDVRILNERRQLLNSCVSEQNRTALFRRELETISLVSTYLEGSLNLNSNSSEEDDKYMEKWIDICLMSIYVTIPEFIVYIRNRELHSTGVERRFNDDEWKSTRNARDHHQRIVTFRRYLNVLANLCRKDGFGAIMVKQILCRKFQERYLLEWMTELLLHIPSRDFEITEAIGLWLRNILQQMMTTMMMGRKAEIDDDNIQHHQLSLVVKVLQQLLSAIASGQSIRVIYRLSECFLSCIRFPIVRPLLCPYDVGSGKNVPQSTNNCCLMVKSRQMLKWNEIEWNIFQFFIELFADICQCDDIQFFIQ